MDIVELMHALESAYNHALPGREAVERDAVLRQWRSLLEQPERSIAIRAPIAAPVTPYTGSVAVK